MFGPLSIEYPSTIIQGGGMLMVSASGTAVVYEE
jgi:uncharacterized protein YbjQ (UPF0145 family)